MPPALPRQSFFMNPLRLTFPQRQGAGLCRQVEDQVARRGAQPSPPSPELSLHTTTALSPLGHRPASHALQIDAELKRLVELAAGKMDAALMEWMQRRAQVLRKIVQKPSDL